MSSSISVVGLLIREEIGKFDRQGEEIVLLRKKLETRFCELLRSAISSGFDRLDDHDEIHNDITVYVMVDGKSAMVRFVSPSPESYAIQIAWPISEPIEVMTTAIFNGVHDRKPRISALSVRRAQIADRVIDALLATVEV